MGSTKSLNSALVFFCTILTLSAPAATGIGNGGDTLDLFLAATRESIIEVIAKLEAGDDVASLCQCLSEGSGDPLCLALRGLSDEQRSLCQEFILATMADVVRLNRSPNKMAFVLDDDQIYVEGPGGPNDAKQVLARSKGPGPDVPIEFYSPGIRTLPPSQLLALMTHEFGHKVRFKGVYLGDNEPFEAFGEAEGSRHLLDSTGAALAWYAIQHGLVGRAFGVNDLFSCAYSVKTSSFTFTSPETPGRATRQGFSGSGQDAYETGVGLLPYDIQCLANSPNRESTFSFRVRIHEEDGCRTGTMRGNRFTESELWRFKTANLAPPTRVTVSPHLDGVNPVCSGTGASPIVLDYTEKGVQYHFQVNYLGSGAGLRG